MEAMWTRFLPHVAALREVLDSGEIGEVVGVFADHGQNMRHHPATHRLHDPRLAGGALLDLGVYPVSFALDLLGAPTGSGRVGSLPTTGVDGQVSIALGFGERAQASLHTTLWAQTPDHRGRCSARPAASRSPGTSTARRPSTWSTTTATGGPWRRARRGRVPVRGRRGGALRRGGPPESERMTWQGTLDVMRTLDELRRQVGVVYPGE